MIFQPHNQSGIRGRPARLRHLDRNQESQADVDQAGTSRVRSDRARS